MATLAPLGRGAWSAVRFAIGPGHFRLWRFLVLVIAAPVVAMVASGCGSGHHRALPPPRWVQQANALCRVDDRAFKDAAFDSEARVVGLQREVKGLARLGFFRHVPTAALDVETGGRLLLGVNGGDFGTQRKIDRLLIAARRAAARRGVQCSFAAFPLQNL